MISAAKTLKSFTFFKKQIAFVLPVCYTESMKYQPYKLPSVLSVEKLITVYYFEFSKNFHCPPEAHDFWEFHYVDKGSAISVAEDEEILLSQGDILFHKPMAKHQLISAGDAAPNVCVVSFVCKPKDMPFLEKKKLHLSAEERGVIKKFLSEAEATFDLSQGDPATHGLALREDSPEGAGQMMKLHLEELLLLLLRDHAAPRLKKSHIRLSEPYADELVNDMVVFMQENLGKNLSIADFCRQFSYGKTLLCTRFAAATGKTINRFFTELKISAAKRIIREQPPSRELFARISDLLGFSSPSYFYSTFRKVTNMTPSEYFKSVHQYDHK